MCDVMKIVTLVQVWPFLGAAGRFTVMLEWPEFISSCLQLIRAGGLVGIQENENIRQTQKYKNE